MSSHSPASHYSSPSSDPTSPASPASPTSLFSLLRLPQSDLAHLSSLPSIFSRSIDCIWRQRLLQLLSQTDTDPRSKVIFTNLRKVRYSSKPRCPLALASTQQRARMAGLESGRRLILQFCCRKSSNLLQDSPIKAVETVLYRLLSLNSFSPQLASSLVTALRWWSSRRSSSSTQMGSQLVSMGLSQYTLADSLFSKYRSSSSLQENLGASLLAMRECMWSSLISHLSTRLQFSMQSVAITAQFGSFVGFYRWKRLQTSSLIFGFSPSPSEYGLASVITGRKRKQGYLQGLSLAAFGWMGLVGFTLRTRLRQRIAMAEGRLIWGIFPAAASMKETISC